MRDAANEYYLLAAYFHSVCDTLPTIHHMPYALFSERINIFIKIMLSNAYRMYCVEGYNCSIRKDNMLTDEGWNL